MDFEISYLLVRSNANLRRKLRSHENAKRDGSRRLPSRRTANLADGRLAGGEQRVKLGR